MSRVGPPRLAAAAALASLATLAGGGVSAGVGGSVSAGAVEQIATQIELVDQTTWAQAEGIFDVRVRITGAPVDASIELVVHDRLSSRQAFTDSLVGDLEGEEFSTAAQPLVLDASGVMSFSYPVGEGGVGLGRDDHGVYPVSVTVTDGSGATLAELITYLVVQPDAVYQSDYPPLSVAVILDVGAAPGLQPDGSFHIGQEELAEISNRIDVLGQLPAGSVTVAPVPETLDALADNQPTQATFTALTGVVRGREVLSRPFVDLDLEALTDAGLLNQVQPEIDAGAQTVKSRFGFDPVSGVWLAGSTTTTDVTAALQRLGITRTIVPGGSVARVPDETDLAEAVTGPVALADGGPTALVADDALAARLLGHDGRLDAQRFVAELAMIWALAPSHTRGVVVRVPGQSPLDSGMVIRALNSLTEVQTVVRPATVDQMFTAIPAPGDGEEPPVIELSPRDGASTDLGDLPEALSQAQTKLNGLAAMLDDSGLIRSLQRSLWIAPGSDTPDTERLAYVDRVNDTEAGLSAAINAPETFRITLTAREGTIPLSIANTSTQTVRVRVRLTSSQMEFPHGDLLDLDIRPGGERIDVDVRLRASGAFPLRVTITSPDESIVLDRTTFTIRSTAISGLGLVLSVGAGLFLLIWWARHWRTARRPARLIPEHPAGPVTRERAVTAHRD